MAWVAEAQALEIAKAGPVSLWVIEIWLTAALAIARGMVDGCGALFVPP